MKCLRLFRTKYERPNFDGSEIGSHALRHFYSRGVLSVWYYWTEVIIEQDG